MELRMRYSVEQVPQELTVPFTMRKCPSARIILSRSTLSGMTDEELLDEYAYLIRGKGKEKQFYAERYGGHGIFNNGGGARCGLSGRFQVKGIGVNSLGGRSTPSSYSTGSMNLVEAVREFIWSKVLQIALPHGSPEVVAVISLDKPNPKSDPADQRYAIIRETIARVGSLERAFHFKPQTQNGMDHDSLRVKAGIETFASGDYLIRIDTKSKIFPGRFSDSLGNLALKQAEQYAAAKVRRIMHGALTGSNCCIDGGWMDFGSIDHLPSFATTSNFIFGYWTENRYLFESIKNVCHSAQLHTLGEFNANEALNYFISIFDKAYEENLVKNLCYLVGFDEDFLARASGTTIHHLINISRRIAKEAFSSGSIPLDFTTRHASQSGLDLALLCSEAIVLDEKDLCLAKFRTLDQGLLLDLRAISSAYASHANGFGIPKVNAFRALITTSVRRTAYLEDINSKVMNEDIKCRSLDQDNLNKYSQTMIAESTVAFKNRSSWSTYAGSVNGTAYQYCPISNMVISDDGAKISIDNWRDLAERGPRLTRHISEVTEKALDREYV
jgi:hypothetical protein